MVYFGQTLSRLLNEFLSQLSVNLWSRLVASGERFLVNFVTGHLFKLENCVTQQDTFYSCENHRVISIRFFEFSSSIGRSETGTYWTLVCFELEVFSQNWKEILLNQSFSHFKKKRLGKNNRKPWVCSMRTLWVHQSTEKKWDKVNVNLWGFH